MNPLALMAAISKAQRDGKSGPGGSGPQTSREMSVKTDLWLSGGLSSKMDEIQRMSGAQVHVTGVTQQYFHLIRKQCFYSFDRDL